MSGPAPADGRFVYRPNTTDAGMMWQVFHNQDYDIRRLRRGEELLAYWRARTELGERPLIVDAGANIGAAAVYFSRAFPNAQVVAIEPDRGNFDLLARNTAGLAVACRHAAVTARPGPVRLYDPGEGHCGFRTGPLAGGATDEAVVDSVQIAEIFASSPQGLYPFIVKIDIEGAEAELFSESIEWIERTPLIIIELHDWLIPKGLTSRNFLSAVAGLDRDFVYLGENVFSIAHRL